MRSFLLLLVLIVGAAAGAGGDSTRYECEIFKFFNEQKTSSCNVARVEEPRPKMAYVRICYALMRLKSNATLAPHIPDLCICRSRVRDILRSCLPSATSLVSGDMVNDQFYFLDLIKSLNQGNAMEKMIAMKLKMMVDPDGSIRNSLGTNGLENSRLRVCKCFEKLKRFFRAYPREKPQLGRCLVTAAVTGGTNPRMALQMLDILDKASDQSVMARELKFCPNTGCCAVRGQIRQVFTFPCGGSYVETQSFGGIVSLTKAVCMRINATINTDLTTCGKNPNTTITRGMARFIDNDRFCALASSGSSLSDLRDGYSSYTAGMCSQDNPFDRECVKTFVKTIATNFTTNTATERKVTVESRNENQRFEGVRGKRTVVTSKDRNVTLGEISASNGTSIELDSDDRTKEGSVDYASASGAGSKIRSRLRKMIIKQRCDIDGGDIEGDSTTTGSTGTADIQVDGVFTAQRGSTLRRVLMRLKNAGVMRDRVKLESKSRILSEATLLLDGVTMERNGTRTPGSFDLECTGASANLISGRGKRNVLRVRTKSVRMEVTNSSMTIEDYLEVTKVVATNKGKIMIRRNGTCMIDEVEGDGELDIDSDSELTIVRSCKASKLTMKKNARLRIAKGANETQNSSAASVTEMDTNLNMTEGSMLIIENKQCAALKNLTLQRKAKLRFKIGNGDMVGANNSELLVVGGRLMADLTQTDDIVIEIDNVTFCKNLRMKIYLIRRAIASGLAAKFPKRVRVLVSGVIRCLGGRRRLNTNDCPLVDNGQQVVVDCNSTNGTTSSGSTTMSPQASTTTITGSGTTPVGGSTSTSMGTTASGTNPTSSCPSKVCKSQSGSSVNVKYDITFGASVTCATMGINDCTSNLYTFVNRVSFPSNIPCFSLSCNDSSSRRRLASANTLKKALTLKLQVSNTTGALADLQKVINAISPRTWMADVKKAVSSLPDVSMVVGNVVCPANNCALDANGVTALKSTLTSKINAGTTTATPGTQTTKASGQTTTIKRATQPGSEGVRAQGGMFVVLVVAAAAVVFG